MNSTIDERLKTLYTKAIFTVGTWILVRICSILLAGVPVADKFVGLSQGEKKRLGFDQHQIRTIESKISLNTMDISLLSKIITAFGNLPDGNLKSYLKELKDLRNELAHEGHILVLTKKTMRIRLTKLNMLYSSILQELKSHADPTSIPLIDQDIYDVKVKLGELEKSLDEHIAEKTVSLVNATSKSIAQTNTSIKQITDSLTLLEASTSKITKVGQTAEQAHETLDESSSKLKEIIQTAEQAHETLDESSSKLKEMIQMADKAHETLETNSSVLTSVVSKIDQDHQTLTAVVEHADQSTAKLVEAATSINKEFQELLKQRQEVELQMKRLEQQKLSSDIVRHVKAGNIGAVEGALRAGADANAVMAFDTASGSFKAGSILAYAIVVENDALAKAILGASGIDPNFRGDYKNTPLMTATIDNNAPLVQLLLAKGANPNIVSGRYSRPPLIEAAYRGSVTICESLLQKGAHVNAADGRGATSVILAAQKGQQRVVELLVKHGADLSMKDKWGGTAVEHARDGGHTALAAWLRK